MVSTKKITLVFLLFFVFFVFLGGEAGASVTKKGLLAGTITIAPGYMTSQKHATISLHGYIQYLLGENLSIRLDAFAFLADLSKEKKITLNHQSFLGLFFHFPLGHWIPYFGLEPGFGLFRYREGSRESPLRIDPLLSLTMGISFFGIRYFHLFIEGKYVYGVSGSAGFRAQNLSEFKLSFGLGYQWQF